MAGIDAETVDLDRGRALARSAAGVVSPLHAVDLERLQALKRRTSETLLEVEVIRRGLRDLDARLERLERQREAQRR